jgi:DNA-binding HxlR family transcriptional regulator
MRAGAYGLSILSNPLNAQVLEALASGRLTLQGLHRSVGFPPQTTLRVYLRTLAEVGVLERYQEPSFPGAVSFELTASGRDLLQAGEILQGWLTASPHRSLSLGEPAAKGAVKAVIDGWSAKILRALAAKPLTLTELDRLIPSVNYPALERRLAAMRSAGQIRAEQGPAGSRPYKVTDWLRTAVGPLLAAANWEQTRTPNASVPLDRLDAEAAFLLAVPMLQLPPDQKGACGLAIKLSEDGDPEAAGVVAEFDHGRLVACRSDKHIKASTQAVGPAATWVNVFSGQADSGLETDGDEGLVVAVIASLQQAFFERSRKESVREVAD